MEINRYLDGLRQGCRQIRSYDERYVPGMAYTQLSPLELLLLGHDAKTVDFFFSSWTPDLIMKLRSLSSSLFFAVEAYASRKWNINTHLRRWFHDVPDFLRKLTACDAVVSGSEAVSFFDRHSFHGHDLDIYVPLHGLLPLGRYLKFYGFAYQATSRSHPLFDAAAMMLPSSLRYPLPPSAQSITHGQRSEGRHASRQDATYTFATFNFVRSVGRNSVRGHHVQLIAVSCDPIEYIINNFHSTGVMNILTGTHALCLFPHLTFVDRVMVTCRDLARYAGWEAPWMSKYRQRGFQVCTAEDTAPECKERFIWRRKVGDRLTWVLPYKRTGLHPKNSVEISCQYAFEVLDTSYDVTPIGAALRVGPRFVYSSISFLGNCKSPLLDTDYQSVELAAAFPHFFYPMSDDDSANSTVGTEVEEDGTETESASENDDGDGSD
ncbi:hypothetical protein GSI_04567 [Ganoderma sinense ZZ0214-1]|uniref:Uncharacterized protein n=1 Tax=Ganoderma sinense ZZ0214-1 TaxID=1077348 RepID=A0A2G8SHS7_9APHY|nr:hypothetical protein GSI_04567 [Ganoderma sinense ZZ0214-1]